MGYKQSAIKTGLAGPDPTMVKTNQFRGLNLLATASQIDDNETPDMQNMEIDELGAVQKRAGYDKLYTSTLGSGKINGLIYYTTPAGVLELIIAWSTKLYKQTGTNAPVEIYSGLTNARAYFFIINGNVYLMNSTNYVFYNGTTVATVESVAYIPTTYIGRSPTGGGTLYEGFNLLGAGFKNSFNGDGATTTYQLSQTGLDATTVVVVYNTVTKTENTHFTVNRTNGTVNFAAGTSPLGAPALGVDNVIITAYITVSGNPDIIKKCTVQPVLFGGKNDTRVFVAGNPSYKHTVWWSGLYDPTYFTILNFANLGSSSSIVKGFAKRLETMIVFKENDFNGEPIWLCSYFVDSTTDLGAFLFIPSYSNVGCNSKDAILTLENNPIFIDSTKGIYMISDTNVKDQKNVVSLSDEINNAFIEQINIANAVGVVFKYKTIIVVEGNAWVWDSRANFQRTNGSTGHTWYYWTNINASCFIENSGYLYFGSSSTGLVYKFKKHTDTLPYNDDGVAISAYRKTKLMPFQREEFRKLLSRLFYGIKPFPRASCTVSYITDTNSVDTILVTSRADLFDYRYIDYSIWTYRASVFPQEFQRKVRVKRIVHIQFKYTNNNLDEGMGVLSNAFMYTYQGTIRQR